MQTETTDAPPLTEGAAATTHATTTVRVERVLPHPPRRVWRALTRPDAIDRWLLPVAPGGSGDDAGALPLDASGRRATLRAAPDRRVIYEVTRAEPERRLDLTWRVTTPDGAAAWPTTRVTWTLTPERGGAATRVVVEHTPPAAGAPGAPASLRATAHLGGAPARLAAYLGFVRVGRRPGRRRRLGRASVTARPFIGRSAGYTERKATATCP